MRAATRESTGERKIRIMAAVQVVEGARAGLRAHPGRDAAYETCQRAAFAVREFESASFMSHTGTL